MHIIYLHHAFYFNMIVDITTIIQCHNNSTSMIITILSLALQPADYGTIILVVLYFLAT